MKITICIPAYDEEKTLGNTILEIRNVMGKTKYKYDIHVQNDGSTDMTVEVAESYKAKVFNNLTNLGLAKTFKEEIKNAKDADIIIHTDADGQYDAKHIPELIEKIKEGNDLVLGSRFIENTYSGPLIKKIGNKVFARIISKLIKKKITDSTTGFRAFNQKVASLKLINTFTYTQEQIIRAAKKGLRIIEIPIKTKPTRKSKLFKNPLDYAFKAWINILRIYRDFDPMRFFGKIGLWFILPGIFIWLFMIISFIATGHLGPINLTLMADFMIFFGVMIFIMALGFDMNKRE